MGVLDVYIHKNTWKNAGIDPVKYLQDEKVLTMFADHNEFGEFAGILQAGLNLKYLGNFSVL